MPFVTRINQLVNRPAITNEWWDVLATNWSGSAAAITLTRQDANSLKKFAGSCHVQTLVSGSEYEGFRAKFYSGQRRVISFPKFAIPYDVQIQVPPWIPSIFVTIEEWREENPLNINATLYRDTTSIVVSNAITNTTVITQANTTLIYEVVGVTMREADIFSKVTATAGGTSGQALLALFWGTELLDFAIGRFDTNLQASLALAVNVNRLTSDTRNLQLRMARLNSSQTLRTNSTSSTNNLQSYGGQSETRLMIRRYRD